MTIKWTYVFTSLIIVCFNTPEISCKEYYCTDASEWLVAVRACLVAGGRPVSYTDIRDNEDIRLRQNTTIWTAEYIQEEIIDGDVPETAEDYVCGYMRFHTDDSHRYTAPAGIQYDTCTSKKPYFCHKPSETKLYLKTQDTWTRAVRSCEPRYELWPGPSFTSGSDYEGEELWVRSVKVFSQSAVKGHYTCTRADVWVSPGIFSLSCNELGDISSSNVSVVNCGTNDKMVTHDEQNNCDTSLEAVCIFESSVDNPKFSRSCFEDSHSTTEVPQSETTMQSDNETSTPIFDNVSKDKTGPTEQSNAIVIATSIVTVIIVCVLVGVALICLYKRRKRHKEQTASVKYNKDTVSTISGYHTGISYTTEHSNAGPDTREYYNTRDVNGYGANGGAAVDDFYEAYDNEKIEESGDSVYEFADSDETRGHEYDGSRKLNYSANPYVDANIPLSGNSRPVDKTRSKNEFKRSEASKNSVIGSSVEEGDDSSYDTTNNIKRFQDSSNIYNHLSSGAMNSRQSTENAYSTTAFRDGINSITEIDSVYDSTNLTTAVCSPISTDNVYSSTAIHDGVLNSDLNTESLYDSSYSNKIKHTPNPSDNIYSTQQIPKSVSETQPNAKTSTHNNEKDATYGNIGYY